MWPYNGKRYVQCFLRKLRRSTAVAAHGSSYSTSDASTFLREDSAAQQAAAQSRGYVYAYPPYYLDKYVSALFV